jgi:hypothetical protein
MHRPKYVTSRSTLDRAKLNYNDFFTIKQQTSAMSFSMGVGSNWQILALRPGFIQMLDSKDAMEMLIILKANYNVEQRAMPMSLV